MPMFKKDLLNLFDISAFSDLLSFKHVGAIVAIGGLFYGIIIYAKTISGFIYHFIKLFIFIISKLLS